MIPVRLSTRRLHKRVSVPTDKFLLLQGRKDGHLLLGHLYIHAVLYRHAMNRSWFMLSVCLPLQQYRMKSLKLSFPGVVELAKRTCFHEPGVWLNYMRVFVVSFFEKSFSLWKIYAENYISLNLLQLTNLFFKKQNLYFRLIFYHKMLEIP